MKEFEKLDDEQKLVLLLIGFFILVGLIKSILYGIEYFLPLSSFFK